MTLTTIPPEVIEKIKKCLALTQSNWEGEAANAMAAAQRLMEEYGLTQAEVEMTPDHQHIKAEAFEEQRVENSHHLFAWEKMLGVVVQNLLPIRALQNKKVIVFIGAASDAAMAATLYRILMTEVTALARDEYGAPAKRAFMFGCATTLIRRSREIARGREQEKDKSVSHALVVVKKTDVANYVQEKYRVRHSSINEPSSEHAESIVRGRAAGHSINLGVERSIAGRKSSALLS